MHSNTKLTVQPKGEKLLLLLPEIFFLFYYMEKSVLLGTKPLVDSIRHFIQDPSGVFSICHLCECHIVQ